MGAPLLVLPKSIYYRLLSPSHTFRMAWRHAWSVTVFVTQEDPFHDDAACGIVGWGGFLINLKRKGDYFVAFPRGEKCFRGI